MVTLKKDTYKSENTYITLFYSNNFLKVTILINSNSKHYHSKHYHNTFHIKKVIKLKSILTNLKIPSTVFYSSPFQILKKAYLQISKYVAQFFCSSPFQILKKAYLQIWKYLAQFFCSSSFQILKKAYLRIWKYSFSY